VFVQRHLGLDSCRGGSVQMKSAVFEVEPALGLGRGRGMFVQLEVVELCSVRCLHHCQAAVALVAMR
jgi:hypothetical protein